MINQIGDFEREYIFVDDGSTDSTVEQLHAITANWQNVTIVTQANRGPSPTLNRAFSLARGEYVKPMDCDDMLLPWASAHLLSAAERTGAEFITALRPDQLSYTSDDALDHLPMPPEPARGGQNWDMLAHSLRSSQTQPSLWLAKREAIAAIGGSDEGVFVQDYSIELKMAARGHVAKVNGPVVRIGQDSGQLSNNEAQVLHDCNAAVVRFLATMPNIPRNLQRLALRRAAGRAWLWALRKGGAKPLSAPHRLKLRADLGLLTLTEQTSAQLCAPFIATNPVRVPRSG